MNAINVCVSVCVSVCLVCVNEISTLIFYMRTLSDVYLHTNNLRIH
jgi:hypothetical protein